MGLEYYAFALFIFILVIVIMVICKFLFSDLKRQKKVLDDTETRLLRTYQTLEEVMEEYYDRVSEAREEIDKKCDEVKKLVLEKEASIAKQAPETAPAPKTRSRKSAPKQPPKPAGEDQIAFEQLVNNDAATANEKPASPAPEPRERVLQLTNEGKSRAEIAKELKITQHEVDLIVGINKPSDEGK